MLMFGTEYDSVTGLSSTIGFRFECRHNLLTVLPEGRESFFTVDHWNSESTSSYWCVMKSCILQISCQSTSLKRDVTSAKGLLTLSPTNSIDFAGPWRDLSFIVSSMSTSYMSLVQDSVAVLQDGIDVLEVMLHRAASCPRESPC